MSQSSNTRIKDAGRKPYNSLNVAFKPVKGESKSTVGQNVRHGLQVLGKVGPRRTPAPTNLPSLRSENSGNDPCINLVPSGQGWVKKENAAAAGKKGEKPAAAAAPVQAKAVPPKAIDSQEISLRPNANVGLGIKAPTLPPPAGAGENQDSAKMTWGNKVQQKQPASGSSQNFHREFPKLGGGGDAKGGESMKDGDQQGENVPDASPQAMAPPPEFMGRMQVPMNMQPFSGERPIFSGAQMQYPYIYPMYPAPHGGRMMPPYPYPYGYPGPGGKVQPIDPRMMERMAKGQMMGMPMPQTERPSVVKDSDLRSLDDHKDDGDNGWAGTHEEVDYSAKLQFDESDDSEDEVKAKAPTGKSGDSQKAHGEHGKNEKNQASQENWNELAAHSYNQQMMMAFPHWQRPPFSGYDPQRGPPPGPHAFPFPGMYPHPMFFQQNMQPQSGDNAEDHRKGGERMECKEDVRILDKKEMDRKARLKKIEEGIKKREEESRQNIEIMKKEKVSVDDDAPHDVKKIDRSRNNSEASDSSRRSNTVDIPPRFRRQVSNHDPLAIGDGELNDNRSGSESPHLTIMKRKDSVKSEDSLLKEEVFKKNDTPSEKMIADNADDRNTYDQRTSRHGSSSSLYKETVRSERQKRYSSSSDTHDKDRHSFHGSSSSIHKENEKKEDTGKSSFSKKELKDLSETRKEKREKEKSEKSKKTAQDSTDGSTKDSGTQKINSGRFADLKLTKGQAKVVSTVKEDVNLEQEKKDEPTKASPWSNVVSGKPPVNDKSDRSNKSLRDIQQEEEEENRKLKKGDVNKPNNNIEGVPGDDVYENHNQQRNRGLPPDETRFRSDGYDDRGGRNQPPPFIGDENPNRGYERRGRFNNSRPVRRENEDGYRQNYNNRYNKDGGDSRGGNRGDQRYPRDDSQGWNQNQRRGEYNNRREDYNDRKDYNRNDYNRNDRRDEQNRDEHKNDGKEDVKGERREDHKNDRQEENKNKRRDDHKTDRRGDHKNERRDDEKGGEKKDEHKGERKDHKNERRDESRGDRREDHRRNERKDDHRNERREEHGHEWKENERNERNNDRRQKDYKKDPKDDINKSGENRREFDSKKEEDQQEERGNEWRKVDKKEESISKRYDKRDNRRDMNKKDGYRKNEAKEDKKDEKKNNYRDDHRKKDDQPRAGRRDLSRPERESGGRRYQQEGKEFNEDNRSYEPRRRKDEWANRDYRLADDYQKDVKEMQESKEKKRNEEALVKESNKQASESETKGENDTEVAPSTTNGEQVEGLQGEPVTKTTKEKTEAASNDVEKEAEEVATNECSMDVLPDVTYSEKVARAEKVETEKKELNDLSEGLSQLGLKEKSEKDIPELIDLTKDIEVQIINSSGEHTDAKDSTLNFTPMQDVDAQVEPVATEVKSVVSEVNEDDGKPKESGGFGVPPKQNKKHSRSETQNNRSETQNNRTETQNNRTETQNNRTETQNNRTETQNNRTETQNNRTDNYRGDSNYRGGDSNYRGDISSRGNYRGGRERGRGRGRGSSYNTRGGSAPQATGRDGGRGRRPSGDRYRGSSSRDDSRRRKDDGVYEPISSDELSDSDTEDKRNKSNNNDLKSNRKKQPPRFQQRYESQESRGRGRGRGVRSERGRGSIRERGRGRGRGRGGSLHSVPATSNSTSAENKGTDDGESDAYYSADETITQEEKDEPSDEKRISSPNLTDRDLKSRPRGLHRTRGGGRGAPRTPRGGSKNGSFLVNRQQVGNKRNSNKCDKTLSAADKSDNCVEVVSSVKTDSHAKNQQNLEDISTHSPPKKSKNQTEKREDRKHEIYKEFDLNNIASVVCIDNIKVGVEQVSGASLEEEGFVTVTSKKQQKEKRDREREELKKKLLLEQKQEQQPTNMNKAPKQARNAAKGGTNASPSANIAKVKPTPFADAPISSPTTEQIHTTSAVAVSSPLAQPSSNVAMAAFGVWEPAQSLMRTSQQSNPCSSDMIKTSLTGTISTSMNAWQRPLSLSASTEIPVPDPRAVGTGKPSSSHTSLMNKSNLVSIQPTSESASTLVTPPVLAPIGSNSLNNANGLSGEVAASVIATDDRIADILPETNQKKEEISVNDFDSDIHQGDSKNEIKREKSARIKMTKTEKAPRFQTRKESEERSGKNDDGRKARPPRPQSGEKTQQKRSLDRPRKGEVKSQSKKTMHSKEVEKQVDENSPIVFINEIPIMLENQLEKGTPKSTLSDADKVVGANKPSLKSQSSLGSYSSSVDTNIEEPIMEVNIQETFQAPLENEVPVESDVQKVDVGRCTAPQCISTLNNDDERSLETRSLPGTPPLAVKIPEPSPPGPSSDPGRGPSPPNIDKSIMPSVAQEMNKEMNEMNRRLLNARRAWEDTPTTWSDTAVVSSSASNDVVVVAPVDTSAPPAIIDDSNIPGSPSKTEPSVATPIEVHQKCSEEKVSVSGGVFSSKRTEQQVCKVKPQQQLQSEEIKSYQNVSSRQARQLTTQRSNSNQKYASYGIPMERNLQQNSSTLYTSESVYGSEQHRSHNNQALNFQSLAPGRSVNTSVSPHSQQRDMVLSSLQVGNMYSANTLQVSQSQFLAWQVTPTVQPTKTVPYQTYTQGSSFTSPVSIAANSPVIMQYGTTSFPPQRSTSDMQRQHQHVNLMPLQQHQPTQQGGRLVSMMPSRGGSHVRRNQQYQPLQSASDGHIVNPNQMPLMLEPNAAANMNHPQLSRQAMSGQQISGQQISNQQISGQQLHGQQRSDLMKHVHAKPFEPTSQTPPLMQSPPVVAPSSLPLQLHQHQQQQQSPQQQPQQQLGPSVFNQPASITHQEHVQNIHNYSQPIIQQRQHGVQHMQHQPPLVASVRPRSIQEQSLSNANASLPMGNQERVNNISPFSTPFLANNVSYKGRSSRVNLQVAVPQAINNQFTQHALQTGHGPSRSPTVALNLVSGPGPIQRPQVHQQSTLTHVAHDKSYVIDRGVANDGAFKQTQRQKMLEDTKKYFEQDQKAIINETEKAAEEKPVSSVAPTLSKIDLSKHNKVVLPNTTKENNGKKFDYKKNMRNVEKSRNSNSKRIQPAKGGNGAATAKKSGD